jgi:glycosyltransferase involved in cell wall biosynthesis
VAAGFARARTFAPDPTAVPEDRMRLDIVFPAHNEESRIGRTLDAYRHACREDGVRFVVALDSCSDRTADIVRHHRARDERVDLIEYPRLGKGGVIAETFGRSDAELVGFVDADGRDAAGRAHAPRPRGR